MRSRTLLTRWVSRIHADRYIQRFGGKVFVDRINGYTLLIDDFRNPLAFVR